MRGGGDWDSSNGATHQLHMYDNGGKIIQGLNLGSCTSNTGFSSSCSSWVGLK